MPDTLELEAGSLQRILDTYTQRLADMLLESVMERGDLWLRVDVRAWRQVFEIAKGVLGLDYFIFLAGIDWLPNPGLSAEKTFTGEAAAAGDDDDEDAVDEPADDEPAAVEMTTGLCGGATRFQVFARLGDCKRKVGVTIKVDAGDDAPHVPSVVDIFRGADWHERETHEMYGINFDGHPGMRNLYLPTGFEGYPLRKDFPLLAREVKPWPGIVNVEQIPDHLDLKKLAAKEAEAAEAAKALAAPPTEPPVDPLTEGDAAP